MGQYAVVVVGIVEAEAADEVSQAAHMMFCHNGEGAWSYHLLGVREEVEV